jgi:hypothetical protein
MNGRCYDPVLGRFLSPDPYIQAPDFSQSFNRYSYCVNNPLKFTDPSGNNPLIIAMAIGAAISAASYTASVAMSDGGFNNWQWGKFGLSVGIGAVSGLAGGYGASAVSGYGAISGALSGTIGGAASGFTAGALNSWTNGSSFGNGLLTGFKSAGIGALTGGLIGGLVGGIQSITHEGNFWTGEGYTQYCTAANVSGAEPTSGPVEASSKSANDFSDTYLPKPKGLQSLSYKADLGDGVYGLTKYNGGMKIFGIKIGNFTSDVTLSKLAFASKEELYLTLGHEYVHVNLNYASYHYFNHDKQEYVAYHWELEQARLGG